MPLFPDSFDLAGIHENVTTVQANLIQKACERIMRLTYEEANKGADEVSFELTELFKSSRRSIIEELVYKFPNRIMGFDARSGSSGWYLIKEDDIQVYFTKYKIIGLN
jgi:hypothetical protein